MQLAPPEEHHTGWLAGRAADVYTIEWGLGKKCSVTFFIFRLSTRKSDVLWYMQRQEVTCARLSRVQEAEWVMRGHTTQHAVYAYACTCIHTYRLRTCDDA